MIRSPKVLAACLAAIIGTAVPSRAAASESQTQTCGLMKELAAGITFDQPAGEPRTYFCPTWVPATAVVVPPTGQGATGWSGTATLEASAGITWHGWTYNLYETYAHTFTREVAATLPPGANATTYAAALRPYNYVSAGADSSSWEIGAWWQGIDGLVVPGRPGEPVPWTPCTEETSPYHCSRIW